MKKLGFWKIYGIVVGVAVAVVILLLVLAGREIDRYDKALPEHIADQVLEEFKSGQVVINYPDMQASKYDAFTGDVFEHYREKVSAVKEWSYKVNSGVTSTTEMVYGIFGDGQLMAYLTLVNKHSGVALGMLAVNDWERKDITPVTQLSTYTLTVDIPTGFSAIANGAILNDSDKKVKVSHKNGNTIYEVTDLFKLPEVEVQDRNGNKCVLVEKDGYVAVENVIYYSLSLPRTIRVFDKGVEISGEPNEADDTKIKYLFGTMSDSVELTDALGQTVSYSKDSELIIKDVKVSIPDNFTIAYGDKDLSKYCTGKEANKMYKYILELNETFGEGTIAVPDNSVYTFTNLLADPEFAITDNLGQPCQYAYEKDSILVEKQGMEPTVPDKFKDLKATTIALLWNDFSQANIGTDKAAFNKVAEHLIKDSYLYNAAYLSWKNGDIARISPHGNSTEENYVKGITVFSDNLVACDVYIRKILSFYGEDGIPALRTEGRSTDTYFFYKQNGKWKLVDVKVSPDNTYVEISRK